MKTMLTKWEFRSILSYQVKPSKQTNNLEVENSLSRGAVQEMQEFKEIIRVCSRRFMKWNTTFIVTFCRVFFSMRPKWSWKFYIIINYNVLQNFKMTKRVFFPFSFWHTHSYSHFQNDPFCFLIYLDTIKRFKAHSASFLGNFFSVKKGSSILLVKKLWFFVFLVSFQAQRVSPCWIFSALRDWQFFENDSLSAFALSEPWAGCQLLPFPGCDFI